MKKVFLRDSENETVQNVVKQWAERYNAERAELKFRLPSAETVHVERGASYSHGDYMDYRKDEDRRGWNVYTGFEAAVDNDGELEANYIEQFDYHVSNGKTENSYARALRERGYDL